MSPIRRCSLKGKSIATASVSVDSESSDSLLIERPRALTLGGMENLRPATGDDLAELNDNERSVIHFNADLVDKEKNPSEKEMDFRLAYFLPMRWTGTDFEFAEEIDPEKEHRFSARKNQKWENHLPTRSSFKSVRKLIFQSDPPAGFTFLIPASHQRPWTPPVGYACVYESWQYTANGIRIMVTLTVLAAELGIKMSVHLFEDLTTPSITVKTVFFYGKMVPKDNVITGKLTKVNFWNRSYFYVKINEASFKDPSVILNGYFNSNIGWAKGCSDSFQEQIEAIRTLSHQHWPDISKTHIQAALHRIIRAVEPKSRRTRNRMGKINLASLLSYVASIGTPTCGQGGSSSGMKSTKMRKTSHLGEGASDMAMIASEPLHEHVQNPLLEGEFPEEGLLEEIQDLSPASQDDEVVEYPHLVDFHYQHTEVPFVGDHEAPTHLFRQIKLKSKGMSELDELAKHGRYQEMTRAGSVFFGSANLMVRDYEMTIKGHCDMYEEKVDQLSAEKDQAVEMAKIEKSRGDLLSKELEEMKSHKEFIDSRLRRLEQGKIEADSRFETTTKRLRESREHEVSLRVEAVMKQQVMPVYKKMPKGTRECLEKIQALGMSMDKVLEKVRADETRYSDELKEMEVVEASEINLQPFGLDEHGSNLTIFSPRDFEDLRHYG
ncbi:hypothetical protein N665_0098s0031 [Sinapis alba]|nr:hypothetical protein N665_0098s0031 [Sinapis alba]